jgi:hypothetical protein
MPAATMAAKLRKKLILSAAENLEKNGRDRKENPEAFWGTTKSTVEPSFPSLFRACLLEAAFIVPLIILFFLSTAL